MAAWMKAVVVSKEKGRWELQDRERPGEALELVASGAVKPIVEVFSKERVAEAYERAASGTVRFKAVVTY